MKPACRFASLSLCLLWSHVLTGQELLDQLNREDPIQLGQQARKSGDVVRGAILFHQGNINCAKCHRPLDPTQRIGPDLSRLDASASDADIVESILQPSKKIREGYETWIVRTTDGQVVTGLLVSRSDQQISLRPADAIEQVRSWPQDRIEAIRKSPQSTMPADLVKQLKDRQQFLDLLRYVLESRDRGPQQPQSTATQPAARELSRAKQGWVLINHYHCTACHPADGKLPFLAADKRLSGKQAPQLRWSARWLNPAGLQQWIENPQAVKPGTTMPDVLHGLTSTQRTEAAQALTHYLVASAGNKYAPETVDADAAGRGYELFQSVGCVACHSPRDSQAKELPLEGSTPLGQLTAKYNMSGLTLFLEDPLLVRPSGHMPNMQLTHREALDISHYLLQSLPASPASTWKVDLAAAETGKKIFRTFRCVQCHDAPGGDELDSSVAVTTPQPTNTPMSAMDFAQGCLSNSRGAWPTFAFDQQQRELIQAALESDNVVTKPADQIELTMATFNCYACHQREGVGGVALNRQVHFQTTNLNLGDQGRLPPSLSGVGAKLNPDWMRSVLVLGKSIRPYMHTRMPQFGESNIGHLVGLFESTDAESEPDYPVFQDAKQARELGHKLAGNQGLNCVACHTFQFKQSDTMPAVDLTEMADRLRKSWFHRYMLAPAKYSPNTVMPSFWPGGRAIRKDLEGTPEEQIEALWQYLLGGRQARAPRGLITEPLEIKVAEEAQILRRSYPGIGKRGIGVGYPGGVNLAFDAEQMRLALIWKGGFADPGGVWRGQGSGNVRPLGRPITLARGPELDHRDQPWVVDEGRPPKHHFKGYRLDGLRRPTFRYTFDDIEVDDFFEAVAASPSQPTRLRRTLQFRSASGRERLRFRLAAAQEIVKQDPHTFQIDQRWHCRIISGPPPELSHQDDTTQLQITFELKANQPETWILEYLWE